MGWNGLVHANNNYSLNICNNWDVYNNIVCCVHMYIDADRWIEYIALWLWCLASKASGIYLRLRSPHIIHTICHRPFTIHNLNVSYTSSVCIIIINRHGWTDEHAPHRNKTDYCYTLIVCIWLLSIIWFLLEFLYLLRLRLLFLMRFFGHISMLNVS